MTVLIKWRKHCNLKFRWPNVFHTTMQSNQAYYMPAIKDTDTNTGHNTVTDTRHS